MRECRNDGVEKLVFLKWRRVMGNQVALYAYTHVAEEGKFDLSGYAQITSWIKRIASQENYIPITRC